jgi:hypothetical protein
MQTVCYCRPTFIKSESIQQISVKFHNTKRKIIRPVFPEWFHKHRHRQAGQLIGFQWRHANVQTCLRTRKTLSVRKHGNQETQEQRTTKRKKEIRKEVGVIMTSTQDFTTRVTQVTY